MSDIIQMGTVLAVAAVAFFGLGYWHARGRQEPTTSGESNGREDAGDETRALNEQLRKARKELGDAREQIGELHADLERARQHLGVDAEEQAAPTPTLGTSTDPELGSVYAVRPGDADDLTVIRGIGKSLSRQLNELGVYKMAQIANWEKAQVEAFSKRLAFRDRIKRDDWVGQARRLG